MKIRSDFVTNSSSSNFTLIISFALTNKKKVTFEARGGRPEDGGRLDYFDYEAHVTVSPKQLAAAKDIDELIALLNEGVTDQDCWFDDEPIHKLFDKSRPVTVDAWGYGDKPKTYDAYDFIKKIRKQIKSMDQIESITITGNRSGFDGEEVFDRTYTYNLKTKQYTGTQKGEEFNDDGSDLEFNDLKSCDITYEEN